MTRALLIKIQVARRDLRMIDDDYRAMLMRTVAKRSSRDLTAAECGLVLDELRRLGWSDAPKPAASGAVRISGKYAGVLRALWLTAWNLGIARDRTDGALAAFVKRQTGIDSPSWLTVQADAVRAIEGLKGWIAREGRFEWPPQSEGISARKIAVIRAQWEGLRLRGAVSSATTDGDLCAFAAKVVGRAVHDLDHLGGADLDRLSQALGRKIRKLADADMRLAETGTEPRRRRHVEPRR